MPGDGPSRVSRWHDDPMTDPSTVASGARTGRGELWVSVSLVTAVAASHLVMPYFVGSLPDAVFDLVDRLSGQELAELAVNLVPLAPLGLVVFLWARTRSLGWTALGVVGSLGLATYLRGVVARVFLDHGQLQGALDFVDATTWVITVLLPVGAALAWGIARRRGRDWWPGLLLVGMVAVLFRLLDLDAFPDDAGLRAAYLALVYHVVPAVVGGLACWWLDVRQGDG